jgi:hypothetical protein
MVRSICVEAEPTHVRFLRDAFWEMDVPDAQLRLVVAAIGAADGVGYFPSGNAREWWGQQYKTPEQIQELDEFETRDIQDQLSSAGDPAQVAHVYPAAEAGHGEAKWHKVEVISLASLLKDEEGLVDLINFDCQVP